MPPPIVDHPPTPPMDPSAANGSSAPPAFDKPPRAAPGRAEKSNRGPLALIAAWLLAGRSSAWLGSAGLHMLAAFVLSLLLFGAGGSGPPLLVTGSIEPGPPVPLEFRLDEGGAAGGDYSVPSERPANALADAVSPSAMVAPPTLASAEAGPTNRDPVEIWPTLTGGDVVGGGMQGRTAGRRRGLALSGGGTPESEDAVERGLRWLAAHQWADGSWRFDLESCPQCAGYCRNSGTFTSTTASTGLALLCFLGAGYTHQDGPYQEEVQQGLYYLTENMAVTSLGGDLRDRSFGAEKPGDLLRAVDLIRGRGDNLYSHGIASLALTEAFAMTRDADLKGPAQLAVNFIVNAQYDDGGWRYAPAWETPGPGDTTVSGWQVMALKSGDLGGLEIPYETWLRLDGFLDSMQTNRGAEYNYLRGGNRGTTSTTAIGLLCRMFRHWPREHRPLVRGVALLAKERPNRSHMYFNYYASQVLHHVGGRAWERWNPQMRDYLVDTQFNEGHESGSWYFDEAHSGPGGRLYTTTMAIMTLEVYYRYLPLYQASSVE